LVPLEKRHAGLRLVLIDVERDRDAALEFVKKRGMEGPVILDKYREIAKIYGLSTEDGNLALPRSFLIDQKGQVQAIYRSGGEDLVQVMEADLETLAANPVAPPVLTPAKQQGSDAAQGD
jgi:alkyl hydroperoxide reductase subunit AhpC